MINSKIATIAKAENMPTLIISGNDLLMAGFSIGDIVRIVVDENVITILRNKNTQTLQELEKKNPSIKKLCEEFNLDITG